MKPFTDAIKKRKRDTDAILAISNLKKIYFLVSLIIKLTV